MAGHELSISRRRLIGAAAAIPILALPAPLIATPALSRGKQSSPAAEIWNARLARYQRLAARAKKAEETGWFRAANERFYRERADPGSDRKTVMARMTRAENLYWHLCAAPMQEAAVALVLTPAPDLEALGDKLTVIRAHRLHEERCMERDSFDLLGEDVRGLATILGGEV